MNADQLNDRVAQPADEEIKKHGDQLARQVKNAAGNEPEDNSETKRKKESGD